MLKFFGFFYGIGATNRIRQEIQCHPYVGFYILNYKLLEKTIKKEKPRVVINSSAIVGINQCEEEY